MISDCRSLTYREAKQKQRLAPRIPSVFPFKVIFALRLHLTIGMDPYCIEDRIKHADLANCHISPSLELSRPRQTRRVRMMDKVNEVFGSLPDSILGAIPHCSVRL